MTTPATVTRRHAILRTTRPTRTTTPATTTTASAWRSRSDRPAIWRNTPRARAAPGISLVGTIEIWIRNGGVERRASDTPRGVARRLRGSSPSDSTGYPAAVYRSCGRALHFHSGLVTVIPGAAVVGSRRGGGGNAAPHTHTDADTSRTSKALTPRAIQITAPVMTRHTPGRHARRGGAER